MALLKCEDCGRDVSDKAAACPSCGCPSPGPNAASSETKNPAAPPITPRLKATVTGLRSVDGRWVYPIPMQSAVYKVGKGPEFDIVVKDETVSHLHCFIERRHDKSVVIGLIGSSTIAIDGVQVTNSAVLTSGSRLQLGRARLDVQGAVDSGIAERPPVAQPPANLSRPTLDGTFHSVLGLVEHWRPRQHREWNERNYSDDLCQLLNSQFVLETADAADISREMLRPENMKRAAKGRAHAVRSKYVSKVPPRMMRLGNVKRRRPDIRVPTEGGRTYIELKLNLRTEGEMNRLAAQIDDILRLPEPPLTRLIVVLVGETRSAFLDELREDEEDSRAPLLDGDGTSRRLRIVPAPF